VELVLHTDLDPVEECSRKLLEAVISFLADGSLKKSSIL
jgi:hypothetical protein